MVTFADLMSLLLVFFVLIVSFSRQDEKKLQAVAGSMQRAFGFTQNRRDGVIELDGLPSRQYASHVVHNPQDLESDIRQETPDESSEQGPQVNSSDVVPSNVKVPMAFASAAASLRQALQNLPEITKLSKNIIVQEDQRGLNILLVDQDGGAMFRSGSRYPYEHTREVLQTIAPILAQMPNRIQITGHTSGGRAVDPSYTGWDLSSDRANVVRQILTEYGVRDDQIFGVTGKSDSEPLFPEEPYLAANRRIEIRLMAEAPPMPGDFHP